MSDTELIRSARFRQEREASWRKLEEQLRRVERSGRSSLTFDEAEELSSLYRQAMNALSTAREISLDRALLDYLENLCVRGYLAIYAPQDSLSGIVGRFFSYGAPQAVRRSWPHFLLALLFMTFGGLAGYWLTLSNPDWYYAFVPGGLSGGRGPEASAAHLKGIIYNTEPVSIERLSAFSTSLFSHNTQVSFTAFALGVMAAVPTGFLMFYNGTVLGAFFAVHDKHDLAVDLFGWLSIHGVTELAAILIAATGGFRLGAAILFPGNKTRKNALYHAGFDAAKLAVLAAVMLLVAGILEGIFRQVITDFWLRVSIGWGIGCLWLAWLVLAGRSQKSGAR